nr:hypothetical protein [Eubacteriales bacterium]
MKEFETPEIKVVMFKTNDVISTSGYEDNIGTGEWPSQPSGDSPSTADIPF